MPSPESKVHIYFNLHLGEPYYLVYYNKDILIEWSLMGFKLANNQDFTERFSLIKTEAKSVQISETQESKDGNQFSENYNELSVFLQKENDPKEQLIIILRAYDNGIAFTYLFPGNEKSETVTLVSEETQIDLYGSDSNWSNVLKADSLVEHPHLPENVADDLLDLPAQFISTDGIQITFSEIPAKGFQTVKLRRRTNDQPHYSVRFKDNFQSERIEFQRNLNTSWRFIKIWNTTDK